MNRDKLLSAYGDGWYDGFFAAKELVKSGELEDYNHDAIRDMSEDAESKSQIGQSEEEEGQ